MRRLFHKDLKMSSFTLQKRQTLSAAVKQKRLERSKVLLKEFRSGMAGAIVWSDEKIFTVKYAYNQRNDKIIGRNVKEIPYNQKNMYQTMKPASIMDWAAVSKTWRSFLIFIDQSTKINAKYYVEIILEPMLKSAKNHFGMTPCGHSTRTVLRHTQRMFHRTGAESIFSGFGLKKCGLHAPRI